MSRIRVIVAVVGLAALIACVVTILHLTGVIS